MKRFLLLTGLIAIRGLSLTVAGFQTPPAGPTPAALEATKIEKLKDNLYDLYYFGRGHTSGDIFVVFPALRTMHAGDMFAQKMLPLIDTMNGGSALAYPETLAKAAAGIKNVDTVIPGHRPVTTWNEFKEFASFTQ